MKKSLIIGGLLVILAAAGLGYGMVCAADQADMVTLTEEVLIGDKDAGEDLMVQINSHWDEKMLWETYLDIGAENKVDTDFSLHMNGIQYETITQSEAYMEYSLHFGYSSSGELLGSEGPDDLPYKKAFADVATRAEAGETYTEIIHLADYYDYFMYELSFHSENYGHRYGTRSLYGTEIDETLAMRIPEELQFEVTVVKNQDGSVNTVRGSAVGDEAYTVSGGTVMESGCYIYIYARNTQGFVPGLSDNGYGVYWMPFRRNEYDGIEVEYERFQKVYDVEEKIYAIRGNAAEDELFLLLDRDGELVLQRISVGDFNLIQEFTLGISGQDMECRDVEVTEQGILILFSDGQIYYAEKEESGYRIRVSHDLSEYDFYQKNSWCEYAFVYENGRLGVVWKDGEKYSLSNSMYVFLLEGEELTFLAHYKNSLDQVTDHFDYSNCLHPAEPFKIWFQE